MLTCDLQLWGRGCRNMLPCWARSLSHMHTHTHTHTHTRLHLHHPAFTWIHYRQSGREFLCCNAGVMNSITMLSPCSFPLTGRRNSWMWLKTNFQTGKHRHARAKRWVTGPAQGQCYIAFSTWLLSVWVNLSFIFYVRVCVCEYSLCVIVCAWVCACVSLHMCVLMHVFLSSYSTSLEVKRVVFIT